MKNVSNHYIDGKFVATSGDDRIDIISPTTGEKIGVAHLGDARDAELAVAAAKRAFETYSRSSLAERADILQRLADAVGARMDELKAAMIEEYGGLALLTDMVLNQARNFFLQAKNLLKEENFLTQMGDAAIHRTPVGVAVLITPWNGSNWFVCMKSAFALAAGCTVVIKPSELSCLQTQLIAECIDAAGIPPGLINIVLGRGDPVGSALVSSPDVQKISFTGSTATGKKIARDAVDTLKRVTLELGGKSPMILLEDAELDKAIPFVLGAGFMNSGQACVAGTRILVPDSRYDETVAALKAAVGAIKVGNPAEADTRVGPMVSKTQYDRIETYIRKGIEEGATVLTGGEGHPAGLDQGNFVKPTIFADVDNQMTIAREEIFGPVLSVIRYKDEADAIRIANDTTYGLQAYISSPNLEHAREFASHIQAGRVLINRFCDQPDAPFGGFKQSGIGREFGLYGLSSYQELKVIFG